MKAALLDAPASSGRGVYLKMDELDKSQLTDRHLPQITSCDLPPGKYRWIPETPNPYGGSFHALVVLAQQERDRLKIEREGRRKKGKG